jgi:murein DD-endopeptidase MepM/ murein hydrolase activator NlpD
MWVKARYERGRMTRALYAAILVIAALDVCRNTAQVPVPATASLDARAAVPPTPVTIDGRPHLVYELHITNYRSVDLSLTGIDIIGNERTLLARHQGQDLATRLAAVGSGPDCADSRMLAAGTQAVAFVWLPIDGEVPTTIHHRISYQIRTGFAGNAVATVETETVRVGREPPVVLAAPLRGGPWTALYDPSLAAGHRRRFFAIDGKARIPARFAIDFVKLGGDGRPYHDDAAINANHYAYGSDVFAVADGTVVAAVDRFPEPTTPITVENEAGNYIALDIGSGRFAFYEHLQPGSVRVKIGDRLQANDVLAAVGASGSVFSGPHLHFHVSDANSALGAGGLPFVFRSFEVLGAFESLKAFADGQVWVPTRTATLRRVEMPAGQTVIRFGEVNR